MLYMVKDGRLRIYVLVDAIGQEDPCRLYMYDASVNHWTNVSKFPVRDACLAAIDDRIYVMGGDRAMYAFDEEHRRLIAKEKVPILLHGSATVAYDGRLYVVGGMCWPSRNASHRAATAAYCYDPARNVWEKLAPMPTGRFGCRACVGPDGLIYVVGGCNINHDNVSCVEAYNVQTNQWHSKRSMHVRRWGTGLVRLEDKLYAVAGWSGISDGPKRTECYDTETDSWSRCEPSFPWQCSMDCAVIQRHIAWKNMQRPSADFDGL
ncbi:influenza virus NS1A-binding protein homolog A-like [Paramacrobiotus metropolitanus]|uniref:influenza virus NS1A-binding protein homolog A-like n=1 Tax=Paramacrobiotus metropolitanus TaxID=2943436 RepID=UPI00244653A0|nr:influenza virus NS1A-binding protein homolog A-like [Paramacrobiotus metropolitanus]